jgi:predicted DCC family thiol-disulfide oxidoreductase YuxK
VAPVAELTVLYDGACTLCVRLRDWLARQPAFVALAFVDARSHEAARRFGAVPWLGRELVVVDDRHRVWAGPGAFVMCLWALRRYRAWSLRMATPLGGWLARRLFGLVSALRATEVPPGPPVCDHDGCRRGYR